MANFVPRTPTNFHKISFDTLCDLKWKFILGFFLGSKAMMKIKGRNF
jgi:hypothetical protein